MKPGLRGDVRIFRLLLLLAAALPGFAQSGAQKRAAPCGRIESSLDEGWAFHLGEAPGSEAPEMHEGDPWRTVSVPHDWAIEGPMLASNPSGGAGAFATMGVGWYRRHMATPEAGCARRVLVQFDGIMANSDVWMNGHLLGHRPNGYVSLRYDVTPYLHAEAGADNVLAVRADNQQQPSSRFYQGAGIYRHVHLLRVPDVHLEGWGTFVTTPHIRDEAAEVKVSAEVRNSGEAKETTALRVVVMNGHGATVARSPMTAPVTVEAGGLATVSTTLTLPHPQRWNPGQGRMYSARVEVFEGKHAGDAETVPFGVRDAHFEPDTGFWINGRNIKIKGVALHSDIGALGMAAPLSLWEHRLRAMQAMGVNAIRTAHNPVAPEFLDLCDRLGLLVLDEFFDCWTVGKNTYDYHLYFRDWYARDTDDTVRRDRNHPSVIAWSAGNEIHDTPHPEIAKPILAGLLAQYKANDPTRPVTQALFRPNVSHDYQDGLADMLDVVGQNYRPAELLAAHEEKPTRKILGTENGHDREQWLAVRDHAAYSGMFVWSGTDYLGESRHWPLFADASGLDDRTDHPKPDALERESWWAEHPVVHVVRRVAPVPKAPTDPGYEAEQYRPRQTAFPDWTPGSLAPHTEHVEVYSNCQQVALTLNGQDLRSQMIHADAAPRTWEVNFVPGTLEARCMGAETATETLQTAGPPVALRFTPAAGPLGTGFDDVGMEEVTVVDAHGIPVPGAEIAVRFAVSGPGVLLATDNADPVYTAPFPSPDRLTHDGRAVAYVRGTGTGTVRVRATAVGMQPAELQMAVTAGSAGAKTTRAAAAR